MIVSGSHLSPTKQTVLNFDISYFFTYSPSKSSFLTTLTAVGAQYKLVTEYSSQTLQTTPAFGVTGLPSKNNEFAPLIRGPYTIKL